MEQINLNYKEFGQGEPIVILHGLFGTLDNWQTIAKQLAENNSVYIIDQRNHGRSPHFDDINYQLLAEDLRHFMESNWMYNAIIVGHSMGGKTAMQFAFENPEMVKKLIVIDIAPKAYSGGHEVIMETLVGLDLDAYTDRKMVENEIAKKIPEVGVRQFLLKNLTRDDESGKFEWKMNLKAIQNNYDKIIGNIENGFFEGETLFVKGANSDYIKEEDMSDIEKKFPNSTIKTIKNAGHWVHAEQPKLLLEQINAFLQK
jgi:esterase